MSILDFPGKLVESATNLTEKKLQLSLDLLKVLYGPAYSPKNTEEMMNNYVKIFEGLKDLTPPEQATTYIKRHKKIVKPFITFIIAFSIIVIYLLLKHGSWEYFKNLFKFFS
jgi:hypothetical protein